MNANDTPSALLEEILALSGLPYLSDLHAPEHAACVRQAIARVPKGAYGPLSWSGAASYILKSERAFLSAEEAEVFLMEALK